MRSRAALMGVDQIKLVSDFLIVPGCLPEASTSNGSPALWPGFHVFAIGKSAGIVRDRQVLLFFAEGAAAWDMIAGFSRLGWPA